MGRQHTHPGHAGGGDATAGHGQPEGVGASPTDQARAVVGAQDPVRLESTLDVRPGLLLDLATAGILDRLDIGA